MLNSKTLNLVQRIVAFAAMLLLVLFTSLPAAAQTAPQQPTPKTTVQQVTAPKTTAPQTQSVNSSIKVDQNFDHQTTRFPLSGQHVKVTCETCHNGGIFKGTPTTCIGCHNETLAKGKSVNHPQTTNECADCHNNVDFSQVHVDHSKISKGCLTCHNNVNAEGKNKIHIKSVNTCEDCHLTTTWRVVRFDHDTTHEPCSTCHDNTRATGKPFNHIRSSNDCAQCHRTISWKLGVFDHTGVVDGCSKCHDGINATGKSANHLLTSDACQNCHTTFAWRPAHFDHTDSTVTSNGVSCADCHDGKRATGRSLAHYPTNTMDCVLCHAAPGKNAAVGTGWKPAKWFHQYAADESNCYACHTGQHLPALGQAQAPGKHIPSSIACANCHVNTNNYQVWTGAVMNHPLENISGNCVSCHNGNFVGGTGVKTTMKSLSTHLKPTSDTCENCHTNFVAWAPANFNHNDSMVLGAECNACHDGTHVLGSGAIVVGKLQGVNHSHLDTNTNCAACHGAPTAPGQTFTNNLKAFDHSQASAPLSCSNCHNGVQATGMLTGPSHSHVPVSGGTQCLDCHKNYVAWVPAVFDHSKVTTVCLTCHNGTMKITKGLLTFQDTATHIATNLGCENCHNTTTWKTSLFDHAGIGNTACFTCHDGGLHGGAAPVTGKMNATIAHIPTDNNCVNCHNTTAWSPVVFDAAKHGLPGVSTVCTDCHNGTQAITKGKLTSKPTPHLTIATGQNCSDCHTSFTTWVTTFTHNAASMGTKTCVQCHDGVQAKGKKNAFVPHVPTSDVCSDCHKNFVAFNPVVFDATLHGLVSATCADCHNGTQAISTGVLVSKANFPNHIPTGTTNCAQCHTSFTTWVTTFDHKNIGTATCFSCHDGKTATTKGTNHVPSSTTCENCHSKTSFTAWTPVIMPFPHSDPTGNAAACETCHDGVRATGIDTAHINTSSTACASCHNSKAVWTTLFANFHNFVSPVCVSCHDGGHKTATKPITGKDAPHMATSDACENCHVGNNTGWTPAKLPFDHGQTTASCYTCHDGGHKLAAGGPVVFKIAGHVPTSNECALCHTSTSKFSVWSMQHSDTIVLTKQCKDCHDGQFAGVVARSKAATIPAAPAHVSPDFDKCDSCHNTVNFAQAIFDHTGVLAANTPCVSCHNTGQKNAVVRPVNHAAISGGAAGTPDCKQCHITTTWVTNARPDHSTFTSTTDCFTGCHDGAHSGMPKNVGHFATKNLCGYCHNTNSFKPASFDHGQALSTTDCYTACHDGAHAPALGKSSFPTHLPTSNTCANCHSGYASWVTTKFDHTDTIVQAAKCNDCHDGAHSPALAHSSAHFASSTTCNACHNTTNVGFKPVIAIDHSAITGFMGTCVSCHDGSKSISTGPVVGKSPTHFNTSADCVQCHNYATITLTTKFTPASGFAHSQTTAICFSCHDGSHTTQFKGPVLAKTPTHINSTSTCANCHTTTAFKPGNKQNWTDHTQVIGSCYSCHTGTVVVSTGTSSIGFIMGQLQGPSGKHMPTGNVCETCHSTTSFIPALAFDHSNVAAGTCFSCHNNVQAKGKTTGHMATLNTCDDCHIKPPPSQFYPVTRTQFKHTSALGVCSSCHGTGVALFTLRSGLSVTASSTAHIAASKTCDACHKTTANWNVTSAQVDHTQVTGSCISCHSGSIKLSLTGGTISFKSATHIPSTSTCDACHAIGGVPWTPAKVMDHTQATGACYGCHNGTSKTTVQIITPKDAAHLNTTNLCASCHVYTSWKATTFDHSQAIGACMSCHNGTSKMGVTGTLLDHTGTTHMLVPTHDCGLCHATANTVNALTVWPFVSYAHTSPAYVAHTTATTVPAGTAGCPVCHKQNNEKITYLSPALFPNCAACHSNKYKASAHLKYSTPVTTYYTFTELKDCTGACHVYADQTLSTIKQSKTTNSHHRPTFSSWN